MYLELNKVCEELSRRMTDLEYSLDLAGKKAEIEVLEKQMEAPGFWQDQGRAQKLTRQMAGLRGRVEGFELIRSNFEDALVLLELGEEVEDVDTARELEQSLAELERMVAAQELELLLSEPYDERNAILSLHAGAGGLEAQDWVEMLFRMYVRWAEKRGYTVEVLDILPDEEAGLKSVTWQVSGPMAFGYLKAEKGVHRLVRISPFDTGGRRHTSFASLDVLPEVEENTEVEIKPDDVRVDTFRAGGAGGQHVNKTDSAVRLTHLSTGIVVSCQNERSQTSNRQAAFRLLQAKLMDLELRRRNQEIAALRGEQPDIAWGSQIRSYVFHPYALAKDHRTKYEKGNVEVVMNGEIDEFIQAYLIWRVKQQR
ncbi:MAG: peptide chain release factor 2 [Candidatus Desulforudis sp.]|nr:peptide chain release factor 2 [Desulforudis sp.]